VTCARRELVPASVRSARSARPARGTGGSRSRGTGGDRRGYGSPRSSRLAHPTPMCSNGASLRTSCVAHGGCVQWTRSAARRASVSCAPSFEASLRSALSRWRMASIPARRDALGDMEARGTLPGSNGTPTQVPIRCAKSSMVWICLPSRSMSSTMLRRSTWAQPRSIALSLQATIPSTSGLSAATPGQSGAGAKSPAHHSAQPSLNAT